MAVMIAADVQRGADARTQVSHSTASGRGALQKRIALTAPLRSHPQTVGRLVRR